jgi:hypothetical protein
MQVTLFINRVNTGVPTQGPGVRHFGGAHARELAVYEIGPDLAFDHGKASVADVLQQQHTQDDFGGNAQPPAASMVPTVRRFVER